MSDADTGRESDAIQAVLDTEAAERLASESSLDMPLAALIARAPVTCGPDESLRGAVRQLHQHRVGSIVVCNPLDQPLGIFTLHDLRTVVAGGESDFERPIHEFMTPAPLGLPPQARAFDAAIIMAGRHFGHVCVVEQGKLIGVISERDLFALQRVKLVQLTRVISQAPDVAALVAVRPRIVALIDTLLAQGVGVEQLTKIITLLNDHTVIRAIELCLAEHGDPGVPFSWIAFGSEGRREQTLSTDQDNGILFEAEDADRARETLLPLARRINEVLAECGFPLCKGNVMACNPRLCLSLDEWQATFANMIDQATPENLLRSSIYFDLRGIYGDAEAVSRLQSSVLERASNNAIFQHMMTANALRARPPLGWLRDFVTRREGGERPTLDLKVQGLTAFVDGARIMSLTHRIEQTNTFDRLTALVDAGEVDAAQGQAWCAAFSFIQLLRMRSHQAQSRRGEAMNNRLDPDTLNPLDRQILKESFRQAQSLQRHLELKYRV